MTVKAKTTNRQQQKAATRQALKAAALSCVSDRNYADVQISDITQKAGVAKGTFYVHFKTKEALFDELRREFNLEFLQAVLAVWQEHQGNLEVLVRQIASVFLERWKANKIFIRAYAQRLAIGASFDEIRDGVNPEMRQFLAKAMVEALAKEELHLREPDLVIQGILALWMRFGLQVLFGPARNHKFIAALLAKLTLGAVRGAAERT